MHQLAPCFLPTPFRYFPYSIVSYYALDLLTISGAASSQPAVRACGLADQDTAERLGHYEQA
jgi:hypothetical protein